MRKLGLDKRKAFTQVFRVKRPRQAQLDANDQSPHMVHQRGDEFFEVHIFFQANEGNYGFVNTSICNSNWFFFASEKRAIQIHDSDSEQNDDISDGVVETYDIASCDSADSIASEEGPEREEVLANGCIDIIDISRFMAQQLFFLNLFCGKRHDDDIQCAVEYQTQS